MSDMSRRGFIGGTAGAAALSAVPARDARAAEPGDGPVRAVHLTVEHLVAPLGIDAARPRFGWRLEAGGTGRSQSAYQIAVGSAAGRADVWDSGRVASGEQTARVYGGPALRSRTRYHWRVRVWDEGGRAGPWSAASWFETALMREEEWTARWIGTGVVLPPSPHTLGPRRLFPARLEDGHTLGQTFRSRSRLTAVAVLLTAGTGAGCVMTLHRDGPGGAVLGRRELSGLDGQVQGRLDLPSPVEGGAFYLELSRVRGELSWMGAGADAYPHGDAHRDGVREADDRWLFGIPPDPPAAPLVRAEFDVPGEVAAARLYVSGLGHAVSRINGRRVGDAVLSPVVTDYDRRALFTSHDVTGLVRRGRNAVGIALGRGFFATRAPETDGSHLAPWVAEPRVRAELVVTLADGRAVTVRTGPDWRVTEGPTTAESAMGGESYDARRAARLEGWSEPGFRAAGWRPAVVVERPAGRVEAYAAEPVRTHEAIRPVAVTRRDGVRVYDFGPTLAGWARLRARLPEGTTVRMRYGEKLDDRGRVFVGAPGWHHNPAVTGRYQVDEFTAAGRGVETWEPSFTYKGFRYVEVSGTDRDLDLVAVPVRGDLADTMDLRVGHPVTQWIVGAFAQSARGVLFGHPAIGPAGGKSGWTGNAHFAAQPMLYRFGAASLFAKWLEDLRLRQAPDGRLPLVAPLGDDLAGEPSPTWTGVYPYLVRRYWMTYGDPTVPERHFDAVARYAEWLLAQAGDGLMDDRFGDWYPPHGTGNPQAPEGGRLVGTAHLVQSLRDATALADLLGRADHARRWRSRTEELVRRFNAAFLDTGAGHYRTDRAVGYRQTSNAVPLAFGLVPAEHARRVAAGLAADVEARGRHLNTGCAGTATLPYALSDHGRADLAHAVLAQETYPSYGYLRGLGATTFWENWESTARGRNDPILSSPVTWLVERVVGVEMLRPGWARFAVAPRAFGPLASARVALDTVRGRIEVAWRRRGGTLVLDVRVPVNAVAEVAVPGGRRELGSGRHRVEAPVRG
ncbi:alpha-L-rhamnosidase [Actinomadura kijaniata]|uniref:alpha-L-rhamnosidase n=1 Tax=Actinomadura kijaniata TaxID=46161 RepID=UPI000836A8E5|nr:alpha-L-rhamnosidase [Actinomadura kijaniata]